MKKSILAILSVALFAFMAVSCEPKPEPQPDVQTITLAETNVTVASGETYMIPVTGVPDTYSGTFEVGFPIDGKMEVYRVDYLDPNHPASPLLAQITYSQADKACVVTVNKGYYGLEDFLLIYKQDGFANVESNICRLTVPEPSKK